MNSLSILNRMPVLGFNFEARLNIAHLQTDEETSFVRSHEAHQTITVDNAIKFAGCIPIVSLFVGALRLGMIYGAYQNSLTDAETKENLLNTDNLPEHRREMLTAWFQDRKWFLIKQGTLAAAETCQLSVVLLAAHLIKTAFDYAIATYHRSHVEMHVRLSPSDT